MSYQHLLGLPLRHKWQDIKGLEAELLKYLLLSGDRKMTGPLNMDSHQIKKVLLEYLEADPPLAQGRLWLRKTIFETYPMVAYSPDGSEIRKLQTDKHSHYTAYSDWYKIVATEVSTSSTTYEDLIATISKTFDLAHLLIFFFTHNVKNEGTLASRGTDFKVQYGDGEGNWSDLSGASFRWTDGLADYKTMSVTFISYMIAPFSEKREFKVQWKVDDANYPCWSKNRFFIIKSFVIGDGVAQQ